VSISFHHLSPRFAGRSWKKTSRLRKNRETQVQAFSLDCIACSCPGKDTDFWPNETQLIFPAPLEYRASLVASEMMPRFDDWNCGGCAATSGRLVSSPDGFGVHVQRWSVPQTPLFDNIVSVYKSLAETLLRAGDRMSAFQFFQEFCVFADIRIVRAQNLRRTFRSPLGQRLWIVEIGRIRLTSKKTGITDLRYN
jgi:hypothetical protein